MIAKATEPPDWARKVYGYEGGGGAARQNTADGTKALRKRLFMFILLLDSRPRLCDADWTLLSVACHTC